VENARCLWCGYPLQGLPGPVCPECGRSFDPDDQSTYDHPWIPPSWRIWAKPPRTWHALCVVTITLVALENISTTGALIRSQSWILPCAASFTCAAVPMLFVVVCNYLIRLFAVRNDCERSSADKARKRHDRKWRWLVTPVCLAVIGSALIRPWPLYVRFYLSRPALEQAAQKVLAQPQTILGSRWIGLYYIEQFELASTGCVQFHTGRTLAGRVGFEYDPKGGTASQTMRRLAADWYLSCFYRY